MVDDNKLVPPADNADDQGGKDGQNGQDTKGSQDNRDSGDKPDKTPINPFANLDALRNPQDYEEFLNGEATSGYPVRTLKEGMYVRVNSDQNYSLFNQYVVVTKQQGTFFVYPQFREALGPLPQRCNLHVAVDGHGQYFLLRAKQANPGSGQEDNIWYTSVRTVVAAAMKGWVKVTKPSGGGWGHVPVSLPNGQEMFKPEWPTRPFADILNAAFPEHVVASLNHDLIKLYQQCGV
jgi:hypothetical protein